MSWQNHFPEGCTCDENEIKEEQVTYITCENCKHCKKCRILLDAFNKSYDEDNLCKKCNFSNAWANSSLVEKLNFYGTVKLKRLAKKKNLNNYSRLNKFELIRLLEPHVLITDFPLN
jgi:hypothetical protein